MHSSIFIFTKPLQWIKMKTTLTVLLIINLYGLICCVMKQHYIINQQKTWNDAKQYCSTFYFNLSTFIDATEKQQFLQDSVSQTSDAWVGLYKRSAGWSWVTGEMATQISWGNGQPDGGDCARLHKDYKSIYDNQCSNTHTFFCMNVFEFYVVQQSESWEGALEYCRHHHDDLASLSSDRKMNYALSKIQEAQTQYVWIGLRFLAGDWFWISGDDLQYEVWSSPGQPQCPAQNQRCGALDKTTMSWTNRDCEEKLNFLCYK